MNATTGPFARIARALSRIEANELKATVLSFLFVFTLMAAYFILRPVRDAMASDWSRTDTNTLWQLTFVSSVIGVSLYGFVISRVRFERVVPGVYVFFSATFVAFYFGSRSLPDPTVIDKIFYVWLSVFSLFHVSVFWSYMSGLFSRRQAPRLFSVIAVGASLGAMVGPSVPGFFAEEFGLMNLMLVSAGLLLVPVPIFRQLQMLKVTELGNAGLKADLSQAKRLGRNPFSGFMLFVRDPYLLSIGIFILMYVTMSTFVYMEMREALAVFERAERAEILGRIDVAVNFLAIVTALFATGRVTTRFGLSTTLAAIPLLMVSGWMIVAAVPLLGVLIGLQVARRAGNYAVTKPGREMLFTVVDDEKRYKAKPVIDIVVYRGGDVISSQFHLVLKETLHFGLPGVALTGAVIAAVWAAAGVYLGRRFARDADSPETADAAPATTGQRGSM